MKAITLWQPWATAMRLGLKSCETRHWYTAHRGLLAIHAGKQIDKDAVRLFVPPRPASLVGCDLPVIPLGCILGIVELIDCVKTESMPPLDDLDRKWGNWQPGRYAWVTRRVVWFREPIPAVGRQGLWEWEPPENWRKLGGTP